MPRRKQVLPDRSAHLLRLQKLMSPLVGLPEFVKLMEEIRAQRDVAVMDACNDQVVGNDRLTLAALGEVRAYDSILSIYQARVEELEQENVVSLPDGAVV